MDMTVTILYAMGALAVASALMAWFDSSLPLHVFHMLRRLGYKAGDRAFWTSIPEWESTWDDWSTAVTIHLSPFFSELLTCPVCLSFHISLWLSLALALVSGTSLLLVPAAVATWPVLANILRSFYSNHH